MDSEHQLKYGVPVAARVQIDIAKRLKQRAKSHNESLAQYLGSLITDAVVSRPVKKGNHFHGHRALGTIKPHVDMHRVLKTIIASLYDGGESVHDIENLINEVNQKLKTKLPSS
jgi:hypothetical protein